MRNIILPCLCALLASLAAADPALPASTPSLKEAVGKAPFLTAHAEDLRESKTIVHPFLNSALPRPTSYEGDFFELNHTYPASPPPPPTQPYPWTRAINGGPITPQNAMAYVEALKAYVTPDMRKILFDPMQPNNPRWFQSIWLGTEREPIHGTYVGSGFPAGTLTGQQVDLTTYVYTLYDQTAAATLGAIWGTTYESALAPTFSTDTTQYAEGSVIIKFAFVTATGNDFPAMNGAATWQIYAPPNTSNGSLTGASPTVPVLTPVYLMQFDLIVKDTAAAPETGWVFSTLIYDQDAPGADAWDKMVPLGATWGGDPDIINLDPAALTPPAAVNPQLAQNWINLATPAYARSTLGWDGRLSGPNDGAVVTPAWAGDRYFHQGLSTAGCLGCHSSAQYPMTSFLLPTSTNPPQTLAPPLSSNSAAATLVLAEPGSTDWMQWFQSRDGSTPMGPTTSSGAMPVALDYDMVTAFKAVPMWQAALAALKKD